MSEQLNRSDGFWHLNQPAAAPALTEGSTGKVISYAELRGMVAQLVDALPSRGHRLLGMMLATNEAACIAAYIAALQADAALILVDAATPRDLMQGIIDNYRPDFICGKCASLTVPGYEQPAGSPYALRTDPVPGDAIPHTDLALLLNTSGSTGSPKLVRLSHQNLQANARSISTYLNLSSDERAITSLPMAYSYGLSVINSHLLVGAQLLLTDHGVLRREFWEFADKSGCTSLAGVPHSYEMLLRTGLLEQRGTGLRTITQAGGHLSDDSCRKLCALTQRRSLRFFVMYGQTEATARISYVPPDQLATRIGTIGVAIPGGALEIGAGDELIYTGANVMMGYAQARSDLARGDELRGVLHTGDLARKDADGYFYITGRMSRFLKIFGKRFNLDDVERLLQDRLGVPVACCGRDDLLAVVLEGGAAEQVPGVARNLFNLPKDALQVVTVASLPRTASGKVNYSALTATHGIAGPMFSMNGS
jgi:long-chain acyl-CoA synthetase